MTIGGHSNTYLWLQITMDDTMVPHQSQRLKHLTRETANKRSGEPDESVSLDQLIQVDAQQLGRNAKVSTEVEMFGHLQDVMFFIRILQTRRSQSSNKFPNDCTETQTRTHLRKLSRILISTRA